MNADRGLAEITTDARASKAVVSALWLTSLSQAPNRGAGPEWSPSQQPLPHHQFIRNTIVTLAPLKHCSEHHKQSHSPLNERLILNSVPLMTQL